MQADRGHAAFGEYPRADPSHHADAWALGWFFSAHRAVVRTVRRRVRLGALKSPGEANASASRSQSDRTGSPRSGQPYPIRSVLSSRFVACPRPSACPVSSLAQVARARRLRFAANAEPSTPPMSKPTDANPATQS